MNIIEIAISRGRHICSNSIILKGSKWDRLRKESIGKKVFLFGGTSACDFFLEQYGDTFDVMAVLDSDRIKAGQKYNDFSKLSLGQKYKDLLIKSPDELRKYQPEELAIIITSTNYYEEIAEQLDQMGILHYYVLLLMEARSFRYLPCKIKAVYELKKKKILQNIYEKTGWNRDAWENMQQFWHFKKIPIQENKIVFMTFGKYMDHGKYIAEEILRQELPYELVWLVYNKEETQVPDRIRTVEFRDRESLCYELATAKMWISDVELPFAVRKRKEQIYIQTKHWAGVTLKRFYLDAPTLLSEPAKVHHWKKDFRMIDYMITGSDFDTESCRRGFHFKKEVWKVGSPRTDIVFHNEYIKEKVYKYCQCDSDTKFLLYAPTYRFAQSDGRNTPEVREIDLDYAMLLDTLKKRFGGNWKILLRLHPAVAEHSKDLELGQDVIDVSMYDDVQELVAVSEIMISDYSSVMFESAFIKRPVFLFTTDFQEYIKKEYDLLIKISSLPFPRAENSEDLCQLILDFDQKEYEKKVGRFLEKYGVKEDGNASRRVVEHIKAMMN